MPEGITVKAAELFPLILERLDEGQTAVIIATGTSMYPFIRDGIDRVKLKKVQFADIRRGDIVLILRKNGDFILHRVFRKNENDFYILGDNQKDAEGPVMPEQLLAAAVSVYRKDRRIDCGSKLWRLCSFIWLAVIPFRGKVNRILRFAKRDMM